MLGFLMHLPLRSWIVVVLPLTMSVQIYSPAMNRIGGTITPLNIFSLFLCARACDSDASCYAFHFIESPATSCELISGLTGDLYGLPMGQRAFIKLIVYGKKHTFMERVKTVNAARDVCVAANLKLVYPIASTPYWNWLKSFGLDLFLLGKNPSTDIAMDPDNNDITSYINWAVGEPNSWADCLCLASYGGGLDDVPCWQELGGSHTLCFKPFV